jgi:DNA polymerase-3 subunit gamma/tau
MAYLVLARKYRPQVFEDIVEQTHITKTLITAINTSRISHAYLFAGTRGTGKTTVARILAKCLNCEKGITTTPCGKCTLCKTISNGTCVDVIEMDGASNRGIDEIRNLCERVMYPPASGKYRVYIIDEVHMLTTEAFNALLKTLEEPPPYVIFIFATTEPHKIPDTIVSRCQRFDFRRISVKNIVKQLKKICDNEGISVEDIALVNIAKAAYGSMRDAESILDQMIAYSGGKMITQDDVTAVLGIVPEEILVRIIDGIVNNIPDTIVEQINTAINNGIDVFQLAKDITMYFRNILMTKIEYGDDIVDLPVESIDKLKEQAKMFSVENIINCIDCIRETAEQMRYAPVQASILLETCMVKLCSIRKEVALSEIIDRLMNLEQKLVEKYPVETINMLDNEQDTDDDNGRDDSVEKNEPITLDKVKQVWDDVRSKIYTSSRPALASYLDAAKIAELIDGNTIVLEVNDAFCKAGIDKPELKSFIEDKLYEIFKKQVKIQTRLSSTTQENNNDTRQMTPMQGQSVVSYKVVTTQQHMEQNMMIQKIIDEFDGDKVERV